MKRSLFLDGQWYKGNTHTHSTVSDGKLSPRQIIDLYRENGYAFLALTDHLVYGIYEEECTDHFLMIPGVELHTSRTNLPGGALGHHIVGLGLPGRNQFAHGYRFSYDFSPETGLSVQQLIDLLKRGGNLCILAHPYWHRTQAAELLTLDGIAGTEVYNHTCQLRWFTGESELYYDHLLWSGQRSLCFACDDSHQDAQDYLGGFIMVKAPALTHQALMDAILKGSFYASCGPVIEDFYIEDGKAVLLTSPCRSLGIRADNMVGYALCSKQAEHTKLVYTLNGKERYVRAVCEDQAGRRAYSQPLWLENGKENCHDKSNH